MLPLKETAQNASSQTKDISALHSKNVAQTATTTTISPPWKPFDHWLKIHNLVLPSVAPIKEIMTQDEVDAVDERFHKCIVHRLWWDNRLLYKISTPGLQYNELFETGLQLSHE